MDYPTEIITCYDTWILQWHNHMKEVPTAIQVPPQAFHIHTPLIIHRWQEPLVKHPHQPLVGFFLTGISQGLRIGFNHSPDELKSTCRNLTGVLQHPQVVEEYLATEVLHHCVAGPFKKELLPSSK